ncbi:hypothetical protein KSP40_PGU022427 [Platanthera guangdongensis]|uniref:DC1 domain-containing protein n=1 Tax=Platanthera guangdongensis TaxID=2320717 RepID=A0ABR2LQH3_9ASPA
MGRANQSPVVITHFSHPHPLRLTATSYPPSSTPGAHCACCGFPGAGAATSYSCSPCGFLLHFTCANLHPLLLHPCHPTHGLALFPLPPYSDGLYTCDACARPGSGFVYHCAACGLDLHTTCAMAPAAVSNCPAHAQHTLTLLFTSPYGEGTGFTCDACGQSGAPRDWLYRCDECEFDAHLVCSGGVVPAPAVQMSYSRSYRGGVAPAGGGGGRFRAEGFVGNVVQSITTGLVQGIIGGDGGGGGGGGGSGLTEGLVQEILGGGGSAGDGDGGDGADMSQGIAGGIFGNS